jgi:predicted DNA-binding transcriptional regulator AlpA
MKVVMPKSATSIGQNDQPSTGGSTARDLQALVTFDDLPGSALVRMPTLVGLLGVSKQTVYAWMRDGRWPRPVKFGGHCAVWGVDTVRTARAALIANAS